MGGDTVPLTAALERLRDRLTGCIGCACLTRLGLVVLLYSYDYFSFGVSFFKIAESFRDLT